MANLTEERSYVSVPEFGEWRKRKAVFTRDYSRHFAVVRSVRRYRKKLLSWNNNSIGNGELVDQSRKPVKNPELYRHVSESDNSQRFNNRTHKSLPIRGCMRYLFCCIGR